jgi:hypothetical protein
MRRLRMVVALSAVMVGLMMVPVDEGAGPLALATTASSFPPNCGGGVLTPVRIHGLLVSRVEAECDDTGPIPYWRLKVTMAIQVEHGVWRDRAAAIGEASAPTTYFLVKTSARCRLAHHRTYGVLEYRFANSDPWTLAWRASSGQLIQFCPS